jgi:Coenzyme F420-dependent N5,N10-methylene tetrahydromethanopterin reductase and related flavin-dependent oxidoreductases
MDECNFPYFPVRSDIVSRLPIRERVGLNFQASNVFEGLAKLVAAEAWGVRQVWLTAASIHGCDTPTFLAAAATRTSNIRFGTSIVQVYTRHPLVVAQQALTLDDLAPGRLRLGLGVSHPHIVEAQLGLRLGRPMAYLREYVSVVRGLLWDGRVAHTGEYLKVDATLRRPARVPVIIAALRSQAFKLAGEIADGAVSWMCPPEYLVRRALSSMEAGASANRRVRPPLIAHLLVSLSAEQGEVHAAAKKSVEYYARSPFYQQMFSDAGYPITEKREAADELAQTLVLWGGAEKVRELILETLSKGIDELLLTHLIIRESEREWVELSRLVGSL